MWISSLLCMSSRLHFHRQRGTLILRTVFSLVMFVGRFITVALGPSGHVAQCACKLYELVGDSCFIKLSTVHSCSEKLQQNIFSIKLTEQTLKCYMGSSLCSLLQLIWQGLPWSVVPRLCPLGWETACLPRPCSVAVLWQLTQIADFKAMVVLWL